jgi:hypothetical protein
MIRFSCACGRQLQARDENAGQLAACPECGRQQVIPAASEDAVQSDQPAAGAETSGSIRKKPPRLQDDFAEEAPAREPTATSGKAVMSLVLGLCSFLCNLFTAIPAIIFGIMALRDIGDSRGRLTGRGLAITGLVTSSLGVVCGIPAIFVGVGLFLPAIQKVREAAGKIQSQNNLKQLGLALHNYHDMYRTFPPAAICDKNGKPLLSWRVAILPFIEQEPLYQKFKLDEPWDGPNNIRLLATQVKVYQIPNDTQTPPDNTHYQAFVGNGAAFEMTSGLRLGNDFPDGISNTILIVEAAKAVPWTKPEDLPFEPNKPLPPLGGFYPGGFNVLSVDGAIHWIPQNTPEATMRSLINRKDGKAVPFP